MNFISRGIILFLIDNSKIYIMSKKPFEEKTGIGKFLAKAAPSLLGLLGDIPGVGFLTKLIEGEPSLTAPQKAEAQKLVLQYQDHEMDLVFKDIADARNLQGKALAQDDLFSKRFIYYLAGFWSLFSGGYIFAITFITIPVANTRIVDTVTGFLLGTIVAGIMTYFFGSSQGSKNKAQDITDLIRGFTKSK